jgi:glycosyltransferase involved in cell wall biosynthesis
MKDNILIISDFPVLQYKKDSGTPTFKLIVEALMKKYQVHMICPEGGTDPHPDIVYHPFSVNQGTNFVTRKIFPYIYIKYAISVAKLWNNYCNFKLVYGAGCVSATAAGHITKELGIPSVGRLFGTYLFPYLNNPLMLLVKNEEVAAFKANCTGYIITNDGTGGDVVAKHFGIPEEKLWFPTNGVETPPDAEPYNEDKIHIISMARLDRWKRVDRIIKAFLEVAKDNTDIVLDIVGDGTEENSLKHLAGGHPQIVFHGQLPRKQALELLAKSDIFISTSDYSNVSNSLLEAMAAGKCVIALDTGMTRVVVGGVGILASSEAGVTTAISRASNALVREELGARAKQYAKGHFVSWDERIKKEVVVCEELIK